MSSRIKFVTASVVALGLLGGPSVWALGQEVTLSYRWTKGETVRYRMIQQSTTTISGLPGGMGDMTIDQSNIQTIRTEAEDITPDGTTTLRQTHESVKVEMNGPMGMMSYDSANPETSDNPMNAMLKGIFTAMIGESFTLVIAPTGAVQKVEGVSKLAEKMFKAIPQDPASAGIINGLKSNISDDAMRNMFTQAFAQFPDRPLKPGDTWNSQFTTTNPMLGAMTTSTTSTLKAVEGDGSNRVARIATSVTMKQDATKPAQPNPMGFSMQMDDSVGEGEQLFDATTGRLRRSTTRATMPLTMSGAGPDGTPMTMKTNVKTTITVELVQQ